jgi:hypothetical protein
MTFKEFRAIGHFPDYDEFKRLCPDSLDTELTFYQQWGMFRIAEVLGISDPATWLRELGDRHQEQRMAQLQQPVERRTTPRVSSSPPPAGCGGCSGGKVR